MVRVDVNDQDACENPRASIRNLSKQNAADDAPWVEI